MKIAVEIGCREGTAELHYTRQGSGRILKAGDRVEALVLDAPDLPANPSKADFAAWAKNNLQHAWCSVGIGQDGRNSGRVYMKALEHPLKIRQYLEVNHFLEPDADDYRDHTLQPGQDVEAEIVGSNVVTLIVVEPV